MKKLTVKPRNSKIKKPVFDDDIRFDDARRLRNALFALANMDPGWMWWVEKNVHKKLPLYKKRILVERYARLKLTKNYQFLGCSLQAGVIYSDLYFTDDGHLKMYL
jgi:hypothetical protein